MSLYRNLVAQKCRQSRALCTHLPTVANPHCTVLTIDTFCAQKASFPRFLCYIMHHGPYQCHMGCLHPLPVQILSLISSVRPERHFSAPAEAGACSCSCKSFCRSSRQELLSKQEHMSKQKYLVTAIFGEFW